MHCPNCAAEMEGMMLDAHQGKSVAIDLCLKCQAFWFDKFESLQLSPASTLQLLQLIGAQKPAPPTSFEREMRCPRCEMRLKATQDMQRNTRFNYYRCVNEHGRFIRFFQFLREKDFIRPLSPQQIEELKKHVHMVNCANCGAAVDLNAGTACAHCNSPLSILDMEQPQRLLEQLKEAAAPKPIDPLLPANLLLAKGHVENLFGPEQHNQRVEWWSDVESSDLVQACVASISRWLKAK
jgi:hypothetical protein